MLGKARSGKSSKMPLIIEHLLDRDIPVCIIDPKGDWWGMKSSADRKKAGYPIIVFGTSMPGMGISGSGLTAVAPKCEPSNRGGDRCDFSKIAIKY
jgi:hypothetical protein